MTIEEWAEDFKSYVNALDMPKDDYNGIMEYIDDVLFLLKEQEAKKPIYNNEKYGDYLPHCSSCEKVLPNRSQYGKAKFCPECGRLVKCE